MLTANRGSRTAKQTHWDQDSGGEGCSVSNKAVRGGDAGKRWELREDVAVPKFLVEPGFAIIRHFNEEVLKSCLWPLQNLLQRRFHPLFTIPV